MSNKGKLGSIEALRFVFMIMICFWHCYGTNGFLNHGYIAVEWFFILSGMLLYHSYLNRNEGTLTYTLRKYARFAPEYLTVLVYCYLRHGILPVIAGNRPLDIDFLLKAIPEALMLQDSGFYTGGGKLSFMVSLCFTLGWCNRTFFITHFQAYRNKRDISFYHPFRIYVYI